MKKYFLVVALMVIFVLVPFFVFSQTEVTYPSIPGVTSPQEFLQDANREDVFPLFMAYLFNLLIIMSVAVAVAVMIYGGVLHLISTGDPERKKEAKKWILSAMQGALIVLLSYSVLFAIDSRFVLFQARETEGPETIETIDLKWEIKNIYYQIPFGMLIEDAILNERAEEKLYAVLDATEDAEKTSEDIYVASKELLEIIELCPEGEPCFGEEAVDTVEKESDTEWWDLSSDSDEDKPWWDLSSDPDEDDGKPWWDLSSDSDEDEEKPTEITETSEPPELLESSFVGEEGCLFEPGVTYNIKTEGEINAWRGSGGMYNHHQGVDISANGNPVIYATHGGEVVEVSNYATSRGKTVAILHTDEEENNYLMLYQHLDRFYNVGEGDSFSKDIEGGVAIGSMGTTGKSSGDHLHYEVREISQAEADAAREGSVSLSVGKAVDPFDKFITRESLNCSDESARLAIPLFASLFGKDVYAMQAVEAPEDDDDVTFGDSCPSGYTRYYDGNCPSGYSQIDHPDQIQANVGFVCCKPPAEEEKDLEDYGCIYEGYTCEAQYSCSDDEERFDHVEDGIECCCVEEEEEGGMTERCSDGWDEEWSRGSYESTTTKECSKEGLDCEIITIEVDPLTYLDDPYIHICCCVETDEDICGDEKEEIRGEENLPPNHEEVCEKPEGFEEEDVWCCLDVEDLTCEEAFGSGYTHAEDGECRDELWMRCCETLDTKDGPVCCCPPPEDAFCIDDPECVVVTDGECPVGTAPSGEMTKRDETMLCCCPEEVMEPCPPCPDIAPAVQAKIQEIEGYMAELPPKLETLRATKDPILNDLYQLYKTVMLKSLGHRNVFGYNSLLLERRYYEREEVVIETNEDWEEWVGNILYEIETEGEVIEENDPTTFYLRRPDANSIIDDALRLADEAKERGIQDAGRDFGVEQTSLIPSENFFQKVAERIFEGLKFPSIFAMTNMERVEKYMEDQGISWDEITEDMLEEILDELGIDPDDSSESFDPREIEVKTPSDYLTCRMEIPVGETFELTWEHLVELLDTIDEYIEEGYILIEQQAKMNSLAAPCDCPCEGDIEGEMGEIEMCGQCMLTCDLPAIRAAHEEVSQTRQRMRELADHIRLLTDGHFNTPTEDLCYYLNEDIRDDEEKILCDGGGSKLITKHELITRKLNYSRIEFDECITRPEHLEDTLEGVRTGKMPFFGPLVEEENLPRYTKTENDGVNINTSDFNWFCCSDSRIDN